MNKSRRRALFLAVFLLGSPGVETASSKEEVSSAPLRENPLPATFARSYKASALLQDPAARETFKAGVITTLSRFLQPWVAYNPVSGLTCDGHRIDSRTGELRGPLRYWSAASKESLHVQLLALAVAGVPDAQRLIWSHAKPDAKTVALEMLTKKITSYEKFNKRYPGFGSFLPWFLTSNAGLEPTWSKIPDYDWHDRVPGLDNGQLAWSLFLTAHVLEKAGEKSLARRYRAYWKLMARHAPAVFFCPDAESVRGVAGIKDTQAAPTPENYYTFVPGYFLEDSYEGELMVLFMSLFSYSKNAPEVPWIWGKKKVPSASYTTQSGVKIPVRQGWCYSAHEMWNLVSLPSYLDVPIIRRVLTNGEKVRTLYSSENRLPGLMASVSAPEKEDGYLGTLGIPSLSTNARDRKDVVAPYGAFPVILLNEPYGLAWLREMLAGPRAVGPYGVSEALTTDGQRITPLVTWDGQIPIALALLHKDTHRLMKEAMTEAGIYDRFLTLIGAPYALGFPRLMEETTALFAAPTASIPLRHADFLAPGRGIPPNVMEDVDRWFGGGELLASHRWESSVLTLPPETGYLWAPITHMDLRRKPYINLEVQSPGGVGEGLYVELKNRLDEPISGKDLESSKIRLEFPSTRGERKSFTINATPLIKNDNATLALVVFSDPGPSNAIEVTSLTITSAPARGSTELNFDGRRYRVGPGRGEPSEEELRKNLLSWINFHRGGEIIFTHGETLVFKDSSGWAWGLIPPTNLKKTPILTLSVKSKSDAVIWLGFQNKEEEWLVGQKKNKLAKIPIQVAYTRGDWVNIRMDLRDGPLISGVSPIASIIALSDPSTDIEIRSLSFSK